MRSGSARLSATRAGWKRNLPMRTRLCLGGLNRRVWRLWSRFWPLRPARGRDRQGARSPRQYMSCCSESVRRRICCVWRARLNRAGKWNWRWSRSACGISSWICSAPLEPSMKMSSSVCRNSSRCLRLSSPFRRWGTFRRGWIISPLRRRTARAWGPRGRYFCSG